jgi:uncharacterized protein (DUF58 family)
MSMTANEHDSNDMTAMTNHTAQSGAGSRRRHRQILTVRGYAFLVVGLAVVIGGILTGQRDVLRIGMVLIAICLLALVLVTTARLRLSCRRRIEPQQVELGSAMTGKIEITVESPLPAGMVLLEDSVPPQLGQPPRFTLDRPRMHRARTVQYPLSGRARGRWTCGPLNVRITDPFGLVRADRRFETTSEAWVTPQIHPLRNLTTTGDRGQTGDAQPHLVGVVGADDVLIREYRNGDDVRRVHWPSTARRGELMVRREEQSSERSALIVLDTRVRAHAGSGTEDSLEWAISATASIGLHLIDNGYAVELFDAGGRVAFGEPGVANQSVTAELLIQRLSQLPARSVASMRAGAEAAAATHRNQLVIAIMGRATVEDASRLVQIRPTGATGLAILLDVDSFVAAVGSRNPPNRPEPAEPAAADLLRQHGWEVVVASSGRTVADAWSGFGLDTVA